MTVKRWVITLGIACFVVAIGILGWFCYSLYNKAGRFERLYNECLLSPSDTVVVYKDRIIVTHDTIRPKPIRTWIKTTDTIWKDVPYNIYSDTYKSEGVRINWKAFTHGTLTSLEFPNIFIPERIVTITNQVSIHDTLKITVERSRWGVYARLFNSDFKTFPGIDAGVILTYKGRAGITLGGMYFENKPFWSAGVFFNFK